MFGLKVVSWGKGTVRESGMDMYTLLYLKWITNKVPLYSIWNSAQCYVAAWVEGEFGRKWIHVCIWLSPFAVHLKWPQHSLAQLFKYFLFSVSQFYCILRVIPQYKMNFKKIEKFLLHVTAFLLWIEVIWQRVITWSLDDNVNESIWIGNSCF